MLSARLVMTALLCCSVPALSSDEDATKKDDIQWDKIAKACSGYLDTFATPDQVSRMHTKLRDQISTKIADSQRDEDAAAREIMLDWAASNRGKLICKDRQAILQACFYFRVFRQNGYLIPLYIRDGLTKDNVDRFCAFLDDEVANKKRQDESSDVGLKGK